MAGSLGGTRLSIVRLLQRAGEGSVESLANHLGLATATVRRHLDILQRDRLVSYVEVRKPAGRPEYSFSLTEAGHEALPKAYDRLLSLLLQEISRLGRGSLDGKDGAQIAPLLFQRMAHRLAESYSPSDGDSIEDRLTVLSRVLDEGGFSPEVQLGGGSAVLLVHNCPFRSVAREIDQVCLFDQEFISALLGIPANKTRSISRGDSSCCYHLEL